MKPRSRGSIPASRAGWSFFKAHSPAPSHALEIRRSISPLYRECRNPRYPRLPAAPPQPERDFCVSHRREPPPAHYTRSAPASSELQSKQRSSSRFAATISPSGARATPRQLRMVTFQTPPLALFCRLNPEGREGGGRRRGPPLPYARRGSGTREERQKTRSLVIRRTSLLLGICSSSKPGQ